MPIWSILVFPALFTAGMSLVDTTDSVLMLGAYGWAFLKPMRKLFYNLTITFVSVVVALLIGGIEALGVAGQFAAAWTVLGRVAALNNSFGSIGYIDHRGVRGVLGRVGAVYRSSAYDALEGRA